MSRVLLPSVVESMLDRGWSLLALKRGRKEPHFDLAPKAYLSASACHDDVISWYEQDPRMNIGVACAPSGLVVLDFDYRSLDRSVGERWMAALTPTFTVRTGDGFHAYYLSGPGDAFRGSLVPGVDVKHRGYVAAPPSRHPSGVDYMLESDLPVAPLPEEIRVKIAR